MCNDPDTDIDPSNAWPTALLMSRYTSCHFICVQIQWLFWNFFFDLPVVASKQYV